MLGQPTGLAANASDMYDIDVDQFEALVVRLRELYFASGRPVLRGLVEAVLAPSLVVADLVAATGDVAALEPTWTVPPAV